MRTPDYSIIVPVYNVEPYLRQCVDSILAQTWDRFELFLVDDGSPDGCGAICDEYAARDGRVTVIHQPNRGVTAARRAALDRARADYVCFVDGDDTVTPDWLQTVERAAAANGRPDVLLFGYEHDYGAGAGLKAFPPRPAAGYYDKARLQAEVWPYMLYDRRRRFYGRMIPGFLWNKVFRRSLLAAHFMADDRIRLYEDVAMSYECIRGADSLYVCPTCHYHYRLREDSSSLRYDPQFLHNNRLCFDYMMAHLGRQAPDMAVQINAYFVMRVMHAAINEVYRDQSFARSVSVFREGMTATGFAGDLDTAGLPPHIRLFVRMTKRRLWYPAMLMIRIGQSLIHKKLRLR